jgi:23S rRNA (guanosine2251-2'-O)-methyltransferase
MPDLVIFGRQPILEALASGSPLRKIYLAQGSGGAPMAQVLQLAETKKIPMQSLPRAELDRLAKTDKHQGIVALMAGVEYVDCETILSKARKKEPERKAALLLLDSVEDPRNLGAILRVADGAGFDGVVITKRRCAEVTAATIKTSAGAAFHIPIAQVANLANTLSLLKEEGLWIVGLEEEAKDTIFAMDARLPLALVLGSEGHGLHRLVRERCDFLYKIPMAGKLASLNVATAAAVVCYEVVRQRTFK